MYNKEKKIKSNVKLRKFQYVMIDEKNANIKYNGVENKGRRPYLVINPRMKKHTFAAVPLTSVKSKVTGKKKPKQDFWVKTKLEKNNSSFIKVNAFRKFSKDGIQNYVFPQELYLKGSQRKKVKKYLKQLKKIGRMEIKIDKELKKRERKNRKNN